MIGTLHVQEHGYYIPAQKRRWTNLTQVGIALRGSIEFHHSPNVEAFHKLSPNVPPHPNTYHFLHVVWVVSFWLLGGQQVAAHFTNVDTCLEDLK